ncbi:hypothetical protein PsorP6_008667 [Peronosclerospora sorghi]|uniref:Uncharacterized protein n=1 Tax=Peronosclerospora sorghi TaxID=230839 RepID=A0ACC0VYR4_9STRA|nr:hypothetical protein PsorP6_008667 [Peronosclerospora sorghi]
MSHLKRKNVKNGADNMLTKSCKNHMCHPLYMGIPIYQVPAMVELVSHQSLGSKHSRFSTEVHTEVGKFSYHCCVHKNVTEVHTPKFTPKWESFRITASTKM